MWRQCLNEPNLNLSIFWKNNFPKFADVQSKDIHYLLTNNALMTRNKISKWDKNLAEFCKFCLANEKREKENNSHAMISCERLLNF